MNSREPIFQRSKVKRMRAEMLSEFEVQLIWGTWLTGRRWVLPSSSEILVAVSPEGLTQALMSSTTLTIYFLKLSAQEVAKGTWSGPFHPCWRESLMWSFFHLTEVTSVNCCSTALPVPGAHGGKTLTNTEILVTTTKTFLSCFALSPFSSGGSCGPLSFS